MLGDQGINAEATGVSIKEEGGRNHRPTSHLSPTGLGKASTRQHSPYPLNSDHKKLTIYGYIEIVHC